MKINADLVVELRKAHSWSQEELAITAGLNLRTIQRIESEGSASLQSKKALASAFDIEVSQLEYKETPLIMKHEYKVLEVEMKWKGFESSKLVTDFSEMENHLTQLGSEGWDLVKQTNVHGSMGITKSIIVTLRRPIV